MLALPGLPSSCNKFCLVWIYFSMTLFVYSLYVSIVNSGSMMFGSYMPLSLSPLYFVSYPSAENLPFLYQANFASRIDGAPPFIRGVRAKLFLIQ
jgi:hypothetical protein